MHMNEGHYEKFKEKNKEAGVAVGKLVEIVEPEAKTDVEVLFETVQSRSPEVPEPHVFLVKRIFNRKVNSGEDVEVALITNRDSAVSEDVVQSYIGSLRSLTAMPDYSRALPPELAALIQERPALHPFREVMSGGRDENGVFFYVIPTALLRPKKDAEVLSLDEARRRRQSGQK